MVEDGKITEIRDKEEEVEETPAEETPEREGFMKQMPECLWDMYDEMRNVLVGTESPAYQSITESVAFSDFKRSLDKGLRRLLK